VQRRAEPLDLIGELQARVVLGPIRDLRGHRRRQAGHALRVMDVPRKERQPIAHQRQSFVLKNNDTQSVIQRSGMWPAYLERHWPQRLGRRFPEVIHKTFSTQRRKT
jgi:hypothetical protein